MINIDDIENIEFAVVCTDLSNTMKHQLLKPGNLCHYTILIANPIDTKLIEDLERHGHTVYDNIGHTAYKEALRKRRFIRLLYYIGA